MFTLINYLKSFEYKLLETQQVESQFLDRETYSSSTFNLNSFTKIIINKVKDTKKLLELLTTKIQEIKEEILNQINSNFNNHIILISKIQTVDYLIQNIEKPLYMVKNKIQNKIDAFSKNQSEIKITLDWIMENDKILYNSKISFNYYKLIAQSIQIKSSLEKKNESNIIKNIFDNMENITLLSSYDWIKIFLIDNIRILTLNQKIKNITQDLMKNNENNYQKQISIDKENIFDKFKSKSELDCILSIENANYINVKIQREDEIRFFCLDKLLEICLNEMSCKLNQQNHFELLKYKNILEIIYRCYLSQNRTTDFFEKIKNIYIINELNEIFSKESNNLNNLENSIAKKIKSFQEIIVSKYIFLFDIWIDKRYNFNLICISGPLFSKINSEKRIFNCVDQESFKNNLNTIINLFEKFPISEFSDLIRNNLTLYSKIKDYFLIQKNFKIKQKNVCDYSQKEEYHCENIKQNINMFMQNFSFFTYFQFLQNDLTKLFISNDLFLNQGFADIKLTDKDQLSNGFHEIQNNLLCLSNFIFNFNKTFEAIFSENRLFIKILPNFLNFIFSTFNIVSNKCYEYICHQSFQIFIEKFMKEYCISQQLPQTLEIFDAEKIINIKSLFYDFLHNINNYFKLILNLEKKILIVVLREGHLFRNSEDLLNLVEKIHHLFQNLKRLKANYLLGKNKDLRFLFDFYKDKNRIEDDNDLSGIKHYFNSENENL